MLLTVRPRPAVGGRSFLLPLTLLALLCSLAAPADAIGPLRDLFKAALGSWRADSGKIGDLPEAEEDDPEAEGLEEYPWRTDEGERRVGQEGDEGRGDEEGRKEEGEGGNGEEGTAEVVEGPETPAQDHPLFKHPHHHPGHHHHPVITIYATMTHYIQVTSTKHTIPMCVTAAVPSLPSCPAAEDPTDGGPYLQHSVFTHRALDADDPREAGDFRSRAAARAMRQEPEEEEVGGGGAGDEGGHGEPGARLGDDEGEDAASPRKMKPMMMKPMGWSLFGQKHHHVHHHIHKTKKSPTKTPMGGGLFDSKPPHPLHPAHSSHPMNPANLLGLGNLANAIVGTVGNAGWWGGHGGPWGGGHWGGGHIVQHHGEPYLGPHHHHRLVTELLTKTKVLTKVVTKVNDKVRATLVAQNCLPDASQIQHCDSYPYSPPVHHSPVFPLGGPDLPHPYGGGLFYGLHPDAGPHLGPHSIPNPPYEAIYASKADEGEDASGVLEPSAALPNPGRRQSGRTPPLLWEAQLLSTLGDAKTLPGAADGDDGDANEVEEEVEVEWSG